KEVHPTVDLDGRGRIAEFPNTPSGQARAERAAEGLTAAARVEEGMLLGPAEKLTNPKQYLNTKYGGKDALGNGWPGPTIAGDPTHAPHIVPQEGGWKWIDDAQAILWKVKINPFRAQENLGWAPNNRYLTSKEYAKAVFERLEKAEQTKEGITQALKDIAEIVTNGGKL